VDWIGLALDRNRWRALVNSVLNLRVPLIAGKLSSGLTYSGLSGSVQGKLSSGLTSSGLSSSAQGKLSSGLTSSGLSSSAQGKLSSGLTSSGLSSSAQLHIVSLVGKNQFCGP
jgi:hypothetical protein